MREQQIAFILNQVDILKRLTTLFEAITLTDYGNINLTPDYYHYSHPSCNDLDEPAWKFPHARIYLNLGLVW